MSDKFPDRGMDLATVNLVSDAERLVDYCKRKRDAGQSADVIEDDAKVAFVEFMSLQPVIFRAITQRGLWNRDSYLKFVSRQSSPGVFAKKPDMWDATADYYVETSFPVKKGKKLVSMKKKNELRKNIRDMLELEDGVIEDTVLEGLKEIDEEKQRYAEACRENLRKMFSAPAAPAQ